MHKCNQRLYHRAQDCCSAEIRTGAVCSLQRSGDALTQWLHRLLPGSRFKCAIPSRDHIIRKPSRFLFDTALQKAGLRPEEVRYCGR